MKPFGRAILGETFAVIAILESNSFPIDTLHSEPAKQNLQLESIAHITAGTKLGADQDKYPIPRYYYTRLLLKH
jgi:hypothetical protein